VFVLRRRQKGEFERQRNRSPKRQLQQRVVVNHVRNIAAAEIDYHCRSINRRRRREIELRGRYRRKEFTEITR